MTIQALTLDRKADFEALFLPYFQELEANEPQPLSPQVITGKILPFVLSQWEKGIIRIDLCLAEDNAFGFAIYQIDAPESDWCKRPGWGFIREFYIRPENRRKGFGHAMAAHVAAALKDMGTAQVYLTSDNAMAFWQRCGFTDETPEAAGSHTLSMSL